jgi:hypothetical protein
LDLSEGKQSKGKFTQFKDLYFPKGCGSLEFELLQKNFSKPQISPLARSFRLPSDDLESDDETIPSAQTLNEQFVPAPREFKAIIRIRTGNRNDGFYYPDYSGR